MASFDDHLTETCRRRGDVREVLTGLLSRFVVGCTCGQRSTRNRVQLCTCSVPLPAQRSGPTRDHIWKPHGCDRVTEPLFTAVCCARETYAEFLAPSLHKWWWNRRRVFEHGSMKYKTSERRAVKVATCRDMQLTISRGESKSYIQTCSAPLRHWLRSLKVLSHIDVISG